jgi:hypothetical protein
MGLLNRDLFDGFDHVDVDLVAHDQVDLLLIIGEDLDEHLKTSIINDPGHTRAQCLDRNKRFG